METVVLYQFPKLTREQKGMLAATEAMAKRLLDKGWSPVEVAELTELSLAQVKKLKKLRSPKA